jgi:hypothetical protein
VGTRTGLDDVKRKFLTLGFEPRPLGRPACSQSLYRLNIVMQRIMQQPLRKTFSVFVSCGRGLSANGSAVRVEIHIYFCAKRITMQQ